MEPILRSGLFAIWRLRKCVVTGFCQSAYEKPAMFREIFPSLIASRINSAFGDFLHEPFALTE